MTRQDSDGLNHITKTSARERRHWIVTTLKLPHIIHPISSRLHCATVTRKGPFQDDFIQIKSWVGSHVTRPWTDIWQNWKTTIESHSGNSHFGNTPNTNGVPCLHCWGQNVQPEVTCNELDVFWKTPIQENGWIVLIFHHYMLTKLLVVHYEPSYYRYLRCHAFHHKVHVYLYWEIGFVITTRYTVAVWETVAVSPHDCASKCRPNH